jgi:hypothetical protein
MPRCNLPDRPAHAGWRSQTPQEIAVTNITQTTVVTDIKIPFWSLVVLMVKWALAAVPALVILIAIATIVSTVLTFLLSGTFQWPWGVGRTL